MRRRVAILGSTGSIGRQTLAVIDGNPERFEVVALAAGQNTELLQQQIDKYHPSLVSAWDAAAAASLHGSEIVSGQDGLYAVATIPQADIVVVATSGHAAIQPTLDAIRLGKEIALANKEVIVCAGELIMEEARQNDIRIRPVDSEHNAIWQCLEVRRSDIEIAKVTLTASGGPLLDTPVEELATVTVDEALAHPTWAMGNKVTNDSATKMNKGLEVIEAHWLFDLPYDKIDVAVHPQSIIHSLVSFCDGSVIAQLAVHDMRLPIQYALTYPDRAVTPHLALDIPQIGRLDFLPPDTSRFPALNLAYDAGIAGGTYPTVLSSADEIAVDAFLAGRLRFPDIASVVDMVLQRHQMDGTRLSLEAIREADAWARREARDIVGDRQITNNRTS